MAFDSSIFSTIRDAVPTVPTTKSAGGDTLKKLEATNGAACRGVSPPSPLSPPENDKKLKTSIEAHADSSRTGGTGNQAEILTAYRSAYFGHPDTCPTCRTGMSNAIHCREHNELWQAYDAFRQLHHGKQDRAPPTTPVTPDQAPAPTNGYKVVPTAAIRSQAWHRARDAYVAHRMTCDNCKPSTVCDEGRQLKQVYDVLSLEGGNAGKS